MRAAHLIAPLVLTALSSTAQAVTVVVPAISNPWLAGMPAGTQAISNDSAPAHSPVLVSGLDLSLGGFLTFTNASGGALQGPGCPPNCSPIDGGSNIAHSGGDEHGISGYTGGINALIGVFLTNAQPDSSAAPAALSFATAAAEDFLNLSPLLKQVFFIGDGFTSGSVTQQFNIPLGATRLYLGTHDGFGWFNNSGAITIDVAQNGAVAPPPVNGIPEPSTYALMLGGLAFVTWIARRRRIAAGRAD